MKKIYLLVILLSTGITQIYAQTPCFQCDSTTKAFTIGTNTIATGNNSFAGGFESVALGGNSFAFGVNAYANKLGSIAIGNLVASSATNNFVFGQYLNSTADNSITIGLGSSSTQELLNTKPGSIMFGVTSKPSLTIAKPTGGGDVGYLGIGTDAPEEQVHLRGNLLIESTETTPSSLQFRHTATRGIDPGDPQINTPPYIWDIFSDAQGLKFNTVSDIATTQRVVISKSGSVGIGVATPLAKLEVGGLMKALSANIAGAVNADAINVKNATINGNAYLEGKLAIGIGGTLTNMQIGTHWSFQDIPNSYNISERNNMGRNTYFNGTNDVRMIMGNASRISFNNTGDILLQTALFGFANTDIDRWNTVTLANNGNMGIGTTATPTAKLEVAGAIKAESATLSGELNAASATLSGNLNAVNATLSGNLNAANATLSGALNAANATLTGELKAASAKLDGALNAASAELTGGFKAANANIIGDLIANSATITNLTATTLNLPNMTFDNLSVIKLNAKNAFVNGKIKAKEIEVTLQGWGDHVFAEDYNLMPLNEVAQFIRENSHLPEIPSAKEVVENGIDLGDMQRKMIMKIEELTLYILQQNEKMLELQNQINELKNSKP